MNRNLLPSLRVGYPIGKEKERFTLCLAVMTNGITLCLAIMTNGSKVPLRIIFKGKSFIAPARPGKGKSSQPRKGSTPAEIAPWNHTKFGHPAGGYFVWCAGEQLV